MVRFVYDKVSSKSTAMTLLAMAERHFVGQDRSQLLSTSIPEFGEVAGMSAWDKIIGRRNPAAEVLQYNPAHHFRFRRCPPIIISSNSRNSSTLSTIISFRQPYCKCRQDGSQNMRATGPPAPNPAESSLHK